MVGESYKSDGTAGAGGPGKTAYEAWGGVVLPERPTPDAFLHLVNPRLLMSPAELFVMEEDAVRNHNNTVTGLEKCARLMIGPC